MLFFNAKSALPRTGMCLLIQIVCILYQCYTLFNSGMLYSVLNEFLDTFYVVATTNGANI